MNASSGGAPVRGRLHVYLGAAPGVGKTCEMLARAHRLVAAGVDVVVGVVETHGRSGTAGLLEGLEVVPRRTVTYRGTDMQEMDLPAILERAPRLVLVDELAHTNVPGVEHAKRWQDVDALLAAGIDVHSTLNVQHLESLNDVVTTITGTEQREKVPDAVVRAADEIELVDLAPEQLRGRLRAGEVYRSERVDAALGNYFRVGNLTALRELALLWLADRVDEALSRYRQDKRITDTWETRERVAVAVTGGPESMTLVRRASRIASRSSAELVVVHVLRGDGLARSTRDHMAEVRELAAGVGASVHTVVGDDVPTTLLDFARGVNATQLVLGTSRRTSWQRLLDEGIGSAVLQGSGSIDVHMVTHPEAGRRGRRRAPRPAARRLAAWAAALVVPLLVGLANRVATDHLSLDSQGSLFLVGVLAVSLLGGVWPAVFCAFASAAILNWFFTEPLHSLTIAEPENLVSLLVMVAVAVAVSVLVDRSAARHREAVRAGRDAELLTYFARAALRSTRLEDLLEKVRDVLAQDGAAFVGADGTVLAAVGTTPPRGPDDATTSVETPAGEHLLLLGGRVTGHDQEILDVVAGNAAALVRRREFARVAADTQAIAEADRLRRSLLSAVGHDLRTPLAAAKLSVSSLRSAEVEFDPEDTAELLATIEESVDHLTALVDNLLDSSRLAAGAVRPQPSVVDVGEVAERALLAATVGRPSERGRVLVDAGGHTVLADPGLLERVLGNLVDNAIRHAPGSTVEVGAHPSGPGHVAVTVADSGPGIPPERREAVFGAFQREGDSDTSSGVGLGLSVVRGFVEAMGGTIAVDDAPGGGTVMTVELPEGVPARPPREEVDA